MKISKLLFALLIGAALVSCKKYGENHHEVPQSAKNAFLAGYPGATDAKWEKDGDMYEVEFNYNYTEYEVTYDKGGYIVEVEYGVDNKFLPAGVLEKIEAKYPGKKIEAKYVEYRRFPFYEVEISDDAHHGEGEEHADEKHEIEMFFTASGEEFDGEKKVACIEKCHAGVCKPVKSCGDEKKACCKSKSEKNEKCCDGGDAHNEAHNHGDVKVDEENHDEDHHENNGDADHH